MLRIFGELANNEMNGMQKEAVLHIWRFYSSILFGNWEEPENP
jgi:hypothetical protein